MSRDRARLHSMRVPAATSAEKRLAEGAETVACRKDSHVEFGARILVARFIKVASRGRYPGASPLYSTIEQRARPCGPVLAWVAPRLYETVIAARGIFDFLSSAQGG